MKDLTYTITIHTQYADTSNLLKQMSSVMQIFTVTEWTYAMLAYQRYIPSIRICNGEKVAS